MPGIHERGVQPEEVAEPRLEAAADRRLGDVVAALADPVGDPCHGHLGVGEPQEEQDDVITRTFRSAISRRTPTGQRRLEPKSRRASAIPLMRVSTSRPARMAWSRGRRGEPGGDQVGVDELPAVDEIGQELGGERGLARPVGAGDQVGGGERPDVMSVLLPPARDRLDLGQEVAELAVVDLHAVVEVEG